MSLLEIVLIVLASSTISALLTVAIVWHVGKKLVGNALSTVKDVIKAMTGLGG